MAGIFDGLEQFGLDAGADLFGSQKEQKKAEPTAPLHTEGEFVLDKTFTCPVCDASFKAKVMKTGKARMVSQDHDTRPRFEYVDPMKYDAIMCPTCGYAAMGRYFSNITASQAKLVRTGVCSKFVSQSDSTGEFYTYEYARKRYKMALACTMVKQSKASEMAYLLLRMGWLVRGEYESLDQNRPDYTDKVIMLQKEEEQCLTKALEGFCKARGEESFPIAGMDENTLDYIISQLAARFGKYDLASQLVSKLLASHSVNARMKDNLLELKETIIRTKKES